MSVLRKIGRFVGKVLRRVGDIGGKILSPIAQVASIAAPMIQAAAPGLMASGPIGAMVAKAAPLAPGVLAVAQGVAGGVRNAGGKIAEASR